MGEALSAARVVVTGGDAAYFPLIEELAASLRAVRAADSAALAVIDGGLTPHQRASLAGRYGARILDVGWGFDLAASRVRGREHLKVLTSRTCLDQHLAGAELICWIDADAWIQDVAALNLLFRGAERGALAVVSQTSRYAETAMTLEWAGFGYARVKSQLYKNARRAGLPEALARRIGDRPTLNARVFALRADAPHWAAWRARLAESLRRGRIFTADQLALGMIVHADGMPVELLPETCNYMGPWSCTDDGAVLVERYLPNAPVGIVHLAGEDAMRRDPAATTEVRTLDGRFLRRSLRRPAWVGPALSAR